MNLTRKDIPFEWTEQCQKAINSLRKKPHKWTYHQVLLSRKNTVYHRCEQICLGIALTQPYDHVIDGKPQTTTSCNLHEWFILRQSIELGIPNKRSLHHLYICKEIDLLCWGFWNDWEKWSFTFRDISRKE